MHKGGLACGVQPGPHKHQGRGMPPAPWPAAIRSPRSSYAARKSCLDGSVLLPDERQMLRNPSWKSRPRKSGN